MKNGKATAQIQWQARENRYLDTLCRQRGLEVIHPEAGKGIQHLHTEIYKAQQDKKAAIREAERAGEERLEELRKLDAARAGRDVQKEIKRATERFAEASYDPEELVLKRTPARKTLLGKQEAATVTLREDDFYALADVHKKALGAQQAIFAMREAEQRMEQTAMEINRNRIDSHEVAVDQRVQTADRRATEMEEQARKAVHRAKTSERNIRSELQEVEQDRDHLRSELTKLQDIIAFFPDEWEEMESKTERARRLEELYYAYRKGEAHPDLSYNPWNNGCRFDVDHNGEWVDLRQLLMEYKKECNQQDILHDEEMYGRAEQMEQYRQKEQEWER